MVKTESVKVIKSGDNPISKLLGGGFKQIKQNNNQGGMTIINFKTDIDHPDPERVKNIHTLKTLF